MIHTVLSSNDRMSGGSALLLGLALISEFFLGSGTENSNESEKHVYIDLIAPPLISNASQMASNLVTKYINSEILPDDWRMEAR